MHKVRVYNIMFELKNNEIRQVGRKYSVGEFKTDAKTAMRKAEKDNKTWMKRVGKGKFFPKVVEVKELK